MASLPTTSWVYSRSPFISSISNKLIIGFVQESKAESAIAALASSVQTDATILRDGHKAQFPSTELVPGDLVLLTSGDKVPA